MHWLPETLAHLFHPRRSNNHRPRILHPEAFLAFAFLAVAFTVVLSQPATRVLLHQAGQVLGTSSNITASDVVTRTNEERRKAGLGTLSVNTELNEAALAKANHMFTNQYWAHIAPDGTDPWTFFKQAHYRYSVAGENLARDFTQPSDLMEAWMASPTHRANVLGAKYKEIGVAVVDGKLLGTETTLVVQLFGTSQTTTGQVPKPAQIAAKPAEATKAQPAVKAEETQSAAEPVAAQQEQSQQPQLAIVEDQLAQNPGNINNIETPVNNPRVLGGALFPLTTLAQAPLFSPLQLMKMFFLAIIMIVVTTLIYDALIMNNRSTVRLVGKNFAHILLFLFVSYLLIFFKGGVIG